MQCITARRRCTASECGSKGIVDEPSGGYCINLSADRDYDQCWVSISIARTLPVSPSTKPYYSRAQLPPKCAMHLKHAR